jgi:cytidylate kinase
VAQLARRYGITAAEAGRRIAITDDARVRYHQHYFRANMYDSSLYDLVFNTEVLGLETTVDLATRAVRDLCASLASAR